MNVIKNIYHHVNHTLARLDSAESESLRHIKSAMPIKRRVLPIASLALGTTVVLYNQYQSTTGEEQKKHFIQDIGVIAGATLGLWGASRLNSKLPVLIKKGLNKTKHLLSQPSKWLYRGLLERAQKILKKLNPNHEHHHELDTGLKRVKELFHTTAHDHGLFNALKLELMAIGGIIGGGLGGYITDSINGEDVTQTGPAKLREGIFQFIGNITFCTVAIVLLSNGGKKAAEKLWKWKWLKPRLTRFTQQTLKDFKKLPAGHLAHIPTVVTQDVEKILLENQTSRARLTQELNKLMKANFADRTVTKQELLANQLEKALAKVDIKDRAAVQTEFQKVYSQEVKKDIEHILADPYHKVSPKACHHGHDKHEHGSHEDHHHQETKSPAKTVLEEIALSRFQGNGQVVGTILGLFAGVFGGAILSNQVNRVLTDVFHLPENENNIGLFGHGEPGWLEGTIGKRGLHWWDMILHGDDIPTGLYMAGIECVESFINLLYGISGYLTGTAGSQYGRPLVRPRSTQNLPPLITTVKPSPFHMRSPRSFAPPVESTYASPLSTAALNSSQR